MQAKLHINVSQGVIDVEGDPALVREIYADFKNKLLTEKDLQKPSLPTETAKQVDESKRKTKRRTASKKKAAGDDGGGNAVSPSYSPRGGFGLADVA